MRNQYEDSKTPPAGRFIPALDAKYQDIPSSAETVKRTSDSIKMIKTNREGSQRTKITESNKDSLKLTEVLLKSNSH